MDAFLSIATNCYFHDNMKYKLTYMDCLGFCVFCCVTSNGTTSIAEIAQFLSVYSQYPGLCLNEYRLRSYYEEDQICKYMNLNLSKQTIEEKQEGVTYRERDNMYEWLYNVGEFVSKQAPGIGSEKRHSPSYTRSGENKFDFEKQAPILLQLYAKACHDVHHSTNSKSHRKIWAELHKALCDNIPRIGGLKALELIQLSSMLGLLPLQFSKYASVQTDSKTVNDNNRGPNKLLKAICRKSNGRGNDTGPSRSSDFTQIFTGLYEELAKIFGKGSGGIHSVTEALLENTMCELWRILKEYVKVKYSVTTKEDIEKHCTVENFLEAFDESRLHKVLSLTPTVDPIFVFRHRGSNLPLQNFFKVTRKSSKLRLQMFVIDHLEQKNKVHRFQMFPQDGVSDKTKKLLSWNETEDDGGGMENRRLFLHPCVLKIYKTAPNTEKILNKSYIDSFKEHGDSIAWKSIDASPDLTVDSDMFLLHSNYTTDKKHRSERMIKHLKVTQERLASMVDEDFSKTRKRKATKKPKVSKKKNKVNPKNG